MDRPINGTTGSDAGAAGVGKEEATYGKRQQQRKGRKSNAIAKAPKRQRLNDEYCWKEKFNN
jgi:hypothetical protein